MDIEKLKPPALPRTKVVQRHKPVLDEQNGNRPVWNFIVLLSFILNLVMLTFWFAVYFGGSQ